MTAEFEYMLHLAGCAALGKTTEAPKKELDWSRVFAFANEQTVLPLVQYAVKTATFPILERYREYAAAALRQITVQGYIRKVGVLKVLGELDRRGISAAVVKGFAVARDYAQPDIRVSGDADIYIREEDEDVALEIFSSVGFTYEKRLNTQKDTVLLHPQYGMVELHVRLFDDFIEEIWHEGEAFAPEEPYQRVVTPEGAYYTLSDTDQFLFVLEHMMKHFIVDGLSLRMMLDVGVLFATRKNQLDYERVEETLNRRRYNKALQTVFSILNEYCGFSFPAVKAERETVLRMLEEMELGGVRGMKNERRQDLKDGVRAYNAAQKERQGGRIKMWLQGVKEILWAIFLPANLMQKRYKVLEKTPWLYPFCWIHRLLTRGVYHMRKKDLRLQDLQMTVDEDRLESNAGTKRVQLFRELEIM